MLPDACIIHAVRHPADTGLSCFAQPFEGRGTPWASNLTGEACVGSLRAAALPTDPWVPWLGPPTSPVSFAGQLCPVVPCRAWPEPLCQGWAMLCQCCALPCRAVPA